MNNAKFAFLIAYSLLLVSGCADLVALNDSIWTDTRAETRQARNEFDAQKSRIEARAQSGAITWVQAAQSVKALDRSLAGRGTWKFDSDDEEYHAYSIALAERLDQGQITFAQYDAMRTQRFNQIQTRRQQLNNSTPRRNTTNCTSVRNPDGSVSTTCY